MTVRVVTDSRTANRIQPVAGFVDEWVDSGLDHQYVSASLDHGRGAVYQ